MSEPEQSSCSSPTLSTKKVTSCVASYIWNSPCLKPLVFNPFIVSIFILMVIWSIDFLYGKTFTRSKHRSMAALTIQHVLTTYAIVATGIALNNIIIKHHYRMAKAKNEPDAPAEVVPEPLTTQY
jgi:hypothetical protein